MSVATTDVAPSVPASAIVKLDPSSRRIKRLTATATMGLPLVGSVAAVYIIASGQLTVTDVVLFAVMYFVHMIGITVGFHRYMAHKAFKTSRLCEAVLLIAGSMGAQGPLIFWVATHRRHHRFSDSQGDPHSPNLNGTSVGQRLHGLWYAHTTWMLSDESSRWTVFAPDILRDRRLMSFNRRYPVWVAAGLVLPAAIGFAVGHSVGAAVGGLVFGGLLRILVANQASWCVGSICHAFGGRPFDNGDRSANNWPVAFLTFGEGLQNNHHAFPGSFRHGVRWWEPDLSGWIVAALAATHVVWDARQPDQATIRRRRLASKTSPTRSLSISNEQGD